MRHQQQHQQHKRPRSVDSDCPASMQRASSHFEDCDSFNGRFRGSVSVTSPDRRRVERWISIQGFRSELQQFLEHACCPVPSAPSSDTRPGSSGFTFSQQADVAREVLCIVEGCLRFNGNPGDSYESIRCLSGPALQVLRVFGRFCTSLCGEYLTLGGAERLPWAAALFCSLATSIDCSMPHVHAALPLILCDCRGFGWREGKNYQPLLSKVLKSQGHGIPSDNEETTNSLSSTGTTPIAVMWDAMLTEGGCTSMMRHSRLRMCSAHWRYSVGIAMCSTCAPIVPCGSLSLDSGVVQAALASYCGPILIHCYFPRAFATDSDRVAALQWMMAVAEAPLACVVVASGDSDAIEALTLPDLFVESSEASDCGVTSRLWVRGAAVRWLSPVTAPDHNAPCVSLDATTTTDDGRPLRFSRVQIDFFH